MTGTPDPDHVDTTRPPVEPPTIFLDRLEAITALMAQGPPHCRHCRPDDAEFIQSPGGSPPRGVLYRHERGCPCDGDAPDELIAWSGFDPKDPRLA